MMAVSEYSISLDKFTGKFYKETVKQQEKEKNVVLSALSANVVLSMVALGSQDETRKELCDALCIDDIDKASSSIKATIEDLNDVKGVTLKMANKVYVKPALSEGEDSVSPSYRASVEDIFKSEIQQVDFAKRDETAAKINGWVEQKTNNRIKNLISPDSLSDATMAVLVNAIYFKGSWMNKFDPKLTEKKDFYMSDGSTTKVDMMNLKKKFSYKEIPELDAKAIILPYENRDVSMAIILPNKLNGISDLENQLVNGTKDYLTNMRYDEVILKLPKFKIETTINVKNVLLELGVKRLFSFNAQIAGILNEDTNLFVSEAIQKAFIEVNEEGAEAAAATGLTAMACCVSAIVGPVQVFTADHPFYYQIYVKGQPMFSGVLGEP